MIPPTHEHFSELATQTLEESPEIRDEARSEILGRLAHGSGKGFDTAIQQLENAKPRRSFITAWLAVVAVIILGGIAAWQVIGALPVARSLSLMGNPDVEESLARVLSPDQLEFVFAGLTGDDQKALESLERLHSTHPDDPGVYEDFVNRHFAMHQTLPPGYRETWQRLDPDNGMWLLRESEAKYHHYLTTTKAGTVDPSILGEAAALLEQATTAPHLKSHLPDLLNRRMALFPESRALADEIERILFSISANFDRALRFRFAAEQVIAKEAEELAILHDREALERLVLTWERLCRDQGSGASNMLELNLPLALLETGGEALEKASRDLDMPDLERRIRKRTELKTAATRFWHVRADPRPMNFLGRIMGLSSSVSDQTFEPADFEPGRRVEYALVDRAVAMTAAILLLLLALGAGIESIRRGQRINGLADGLKPLFIATDQRWIFSLGIILPIVWYVAITRFIPLGCRDIGFFHFSIPPSLIQAAAALLLSLTLLVQTIRWRISRRVGFLGLTPRWQWSGWVIAATAAGLLPLAGGVRWTSGNGEDFLRPVAAACGIPLLWLLWQAGVVLFSPRDHALAGTLLARRLIAPPLLLTTLLLACGPLLEREERIWLARDEITRSDPTHGGLVKWEALTVDWISSRFAAAFEDVE